MDSHRRLISVPLTTAFENYKETVSRRSLCQDSGHTGTTTVLVVSLYSVCGGGRKATGDGEEVTMTYTF